MRILNTLSALFLIISAEIYASEWSCQGYQDQDRRALSKLHLSQDFYNAETGTLQVDIDLYCSPGQFPIISHCFFHGYKLSVSTDISTLDTDSGKIIYLVCPLITPQGGVGGSN